MKTVDEMIAVMTAYKNGAEIESFSNNTYCWIESRSPVWNWEEEDYRIKEQKKTVTIEKWLIRREDNINNIWILEATKEHFNSICWDTYIKVKLLDSYEVEIDE